MKEKEHKQLPGGASVTLGLERGYLYTQLEFKDRATGSITITATGEGGDVPSAVEDGSIDLATNRTITIKGFLDSVTLTDAGTGAYSVRIKQYKG